MKDTVLMNKSQQLLHSQSYTQGSNASILFNNSVLHPLPVSSAGHSQRSFLSSQTFSNGTTYNHRNSLDQQHRPFEYLPNPTIAETNHSSLLKDSKIMKKFTITKQEKLASIHMSTRHPHLNIFVRNEGEYDNMTYQAKRVKNTQFIPSETTSSLSINGTNNGGSSSTRASGPYKFQLTKKQYFESIENVPRANFNPFHLVPDINPTQQDLLTTAAPLYTRLPMLYQSHMLDCSSLKKDKDCSAMSVSMGAHNLSNIVDRKFSQSIDTQNQDSIEAAELQQQSDPIEVQGDSDETHKGNQSLSLTMNYDQSAIDAAVEAVQEDDDNDDDANNPRFEALDNNDNRIVEVEEFDTEPAGIAQEQQQQQQPRADQSSSNDATRNTKKSYLARNSNQEDGDETQSILLTLPRMSDPRFLQLPKLEQSNYLNQSLVSQSHSKQHPYASEFDLQALRQAKLQTILADQTLSIAEFARVHPPNFVAKAELAQLAKCMILNASNSPTELKAVHSISLGRSTAELLRISKYEDRAYFERVTSNDKLDLSKLSEATKPTSTPNSSSNNNNSRGSNVGVRQFGRISQGLVKPFNPNENFKYSSSNQQNASKSNGILSLKKQNIIRNVASFNHLSHSIKAVQLDYLESVDSGYIRPAENLKKRPSRFFMPNYMADKKEKANKLPS